MFAMEYFVDADDTSSDTQWGVFADDTRDNTQKAGHIVTVKIPSSKFRDNWENIYTALSDLETTGDLVEVKYRTKDKARTYCTATWTGTDRFNTVTELTGYNKLDEIFIAHGKGAGASYVIKEISTGAGSEVVLDRDVSGITIGQTSKVRAENWKKIGKITDFANKGFGVGEKDHWIQLKLYLQWTGARELYDILINNQASI